MAWPLWISLLVAIPAATVWAISFYMAWSFRFKIRWLGVVSEWAFLVMLLGLGLAGIALLIQFHP